MDTTPYLNQLNKVEKQSIVETINKLEQQQQKSQYNTLDLKYLFDYWHKFFPKQKQNIKCNSCRKAVVKFFTLISKEIINSKMHEVG